MSNKKVVILFVSLIAVQLVFSFLNPAFADNFYWRTVEDLDYYQGNTFDSFDNAFIEKVRPFIDKYRMNLDAGGYMLIAHDFPEHYFRGHFTLLTRPLYPILTNWVARPLHLISDSYSFTFIAGILVNCILFFFTVYLLYWLVKKLVSFRVALLSSALLIFSPMGHVWLIQPETNIFGVFSVMFSLFLFYNYIQNPSFRKLVLYSLMVGILLLGKKLFALSIFFVLLALFFKRYKEGIIFFLVHLIPLVFYSLWIKYAWGLDVYVDEVAKVSYGIWFFQSPFYDLLQDLLNSVPWFITAILQGFLLIPVIFAVIGYKKLVLPRKSLFIGSFIFSFFILFLGMNIYLSRFGFWLFPIIYPLAVLGIDEAAGILRRYQGWLAPAFYVLTYGLIIFISSLNIYNFIHYG